MSPALSVYLALSHLAGPLAPAILRRRLKHGKEDAARLGERLGRPGLARPAGRLVWIHGASVGEAMSALPLAAALRERGAAETVLITTGTVTGAARVAALAREQADGGILHQYVPVDAAPAVRRFLDHWRPDAAVWIESEFWPALMIATAKRAIPMFLMNARLSARSAAAWARRPAMARRLVRLFGRILVQDAETAARLVSLGADPARIEAPGNLKMLIPLPGCDAAEQARLVGVLAGRPLWLAASTHEGEEAVVLAAHKALSATHPRLTTLLAPRHPERGEAIAALASEAGVTVARRAAGVGPPGEGAVWLLDTLGEMGLWYRLAPVAFVGGSIAPRGGHNPFEPAALGAAILHGPQVANFAPAYAALAAAEAAIEVTDAPAMAAAVAELIGADGRPTAAHAAMTARAAGVLSAGRPSIEAFTAPLCEALAGRSGA